LPIYLQGQLMPTFEACPARSFPAGWRGR
jgi:hypothetical protein